MCAHRLRLRLAPRARQDFAQILAYTERVWGVEQKSVYRRLTSNALRHLGEHPDLGESRDELFLGCRALQVGQHVVFYHRPDPSELVVLRIVHYRQDIQASLLFPES